MARACDGGCGEDPCTDAARELQKRFLLRHIKEKIAEGSGVDRKGADSFYVSRRGQ